MTALGLAVSAAELVGTMRGAVELTTGYAQDRRQYGSAIGSFQAVQHLLADAHVAMEGSRSVALHAAWALDALAPDHALAAAALAKAYCARAARTVCETVIQVHGGIGNTWDCLAHVHLRRALLSIDLFGGVGPNLQRVLAHHTIPNLGGLLTVPGRQPTPVRSGGGGRSRWTSVTRRTRRRSAPGCAHGSSRTTRACLRRPRPTTTGPGRPRGTTR